MPISPSKPPSAAVDVLLGIMNRRSVTSGFITTRLAANSGKALALSTPHQIGYLPFDRISRGLELRSKVQLQGWRFLLHGADKDVLAAATVVTQDGENYRLGEIVEGRFIEGTVEAIRRAEERREVREGDYEIKVLMVPSIQVVAVWMKERNDCEPTDPGCGVNDFVMVLPPTHSRLEPFEAMSPAQFLDFAHEAAEALRLPHLRAAAPRPRPVASTSGHSPEPTPGQPPGRPRN